jgi:hypothetical protein
MGSQDPEPLPFVRSPFRFSAVTQPFRIEPHRGHFSENESEPIPGNEPWHVLHEDESRLHLANHAGDFGPDPSLVVDAFAFPGHAPRLAREARRDEIHDATPRAAIEGCEIVGNRREIHGRVFHPRHESGRCVAVPLNVTHGAVGSSDGEVQAKLESSSPGTNSQAIHSRLLRVTSTYSRSTTRWVFPVFAEYSPRATFHVSVGPGGITR